VQAVSLTPSNRLPVRPETDARRSPGRHFAVVVLLSLVLCSVVNHSLAYWLGLSRGAPWTRSNGNYRRVGPKIGPQVFCAGSSLLVSGLSWPEVSESLGQGVENWTVAGSSPEIWEVFQQQERNSNTTIIGVSAYDLNELRLTPDRASYVPVTESISDLRASGTQFGLSRRILTQYAIKYLRLVYPLAGDADKVAVGIRRKVAENLGLQAKLEEHEGVFLEQQGVLGVGPSPTRLSDWTSARVLRRIDALRAENNGSHQFFNGPKSLALRRVLLRAHQQGRVIVVVLPLSKPYVEEFLDKSSLAEFERGLNEAMALVPEATLVRLDRVPDISDSMYFADLVHLNSLGRGVVTPVFLKELAEGATRQNSQVSVSNNPGKQ
jgi:hypothetical protein